MNAKKNEIGHNRFLRNHPQKLKPENTKEKAFINEFNEILEKKLSQAFAVSILNGVTNQ